LSNFPLSLINYSPIHYFNTITADDQGVRAAAEPQSTLRQRATCQSSSQASVAIQTTIPSQSSAALVAMRQQGSAIGIVIAQIQAA
jgi:hypothetical protein